MSELETLRNHARHMTQPGRHGEHCATKGAIDDFVRGCRAYSGLRDCAETGDHNGHAWTKTYPNLGMEWIYWCLGRCSGCIPESEREQWKRIADELDAYLGQGDEGQGALL